MKTHSAIIKRLLPALLILAVLVSGCNPCAKVSTAREREVNFESDVFSLHVGDTHQCKPFVDDPLGLPSMIVETPESQGRVHDWNLIGHNGYCYNLENHVLLHHQSDRYVAPPFSRATAAFFRGHIYDCRFMHYPVAGSSFGPHKTVNPMGRDLSYACSIPILEKKPTGE